MFVFFWHCTRSSMSKHSDRGDVASFVPQTAAVWSFDWPPADRTASWKYGSSPSVKEQVGRPLCPPPQLQLTAPSLPMTERERERVVEYVDCFNLEVSLQDTIILLACVELETDSLIMEHFKTFCWMVCVCRKALEGNPVHASTVLHLSHLYLAHPTTEKEHFVYVHRLPAADCMFLHMRVNVPCC